MAKTDEQAAKIRELQARGATQAAMAAELGVSRARIVQILQARPQPASEAPPLGDLDKRLEELLRVWVFAAEQGLATGLGSRGSSRGKAHMVIAAIALDKVLRLRDVLATGESLAAVDEWLAKVLAPPAKRQEDGS